MRDCKQVDMLPLPQNGKSIQVHQEGMENICLGRIDHQCLQKPPQDSIPETVVLIRIKEPCQHVAVADLGAGYFQNVKKIKAIAPF